jgi:hypothetical protein
VDEAVERGAILEDDDVVKGATVELDMHEVLEEDVVGLVVRALELLPGQRGTVLPREGFDVAADDRSEMLKAHLVDALVDRRNELDEPDGHPVETSSGSASRIFEIGRPFQTFSVLAFALRSSSVHTWTYSSHSDTRKARWLNV